MTPLETFAVAWTLGATVTYFTHVRKVSTSSPVVGFLLSLFAWPVFWIGDDR